MVSDVVFAHIEIEVMVGGGQVNLIEGFVVHSDSEVHDHVFGGEIGQHTGPGTDPMVVEHPQVHCRIKLKRKIREINVIVIGRRAIAICTLVTIGGTGT